MNRRNFIQTTAVGAASVVTLNQIGCGGKSVSGMVAILSGGVSELKILFPSNSLLDKIVSLATDFNSDWVAESSTPREPFSRLGQVMNDLGVNASTRVKLLLAGLGIALRTIAALIQEQGQAQPKAAQAAEPAPRRQLIALACWRIQVWLMRY